MHGQQEVSATSLADDMMASHAHPLFSQQAQLRKPHNYLNPNTKIGVAPMSASQDLNVVSLPQKSLEVQN